MNKKLLAGLLTGAMALSLTACGGTSDNASGNANTPSGAGASGSAGSYKVGVVQLTQHEALDAATQGFQDKLKELDLIPFAMSGHCNLMDAARLPDFVMNMRLARFFGGDYIVSSIGEAHLAANAKAGKELPAQNNRGPVPKTAA